MPTKHQELTDVYLIIAQNIKKYRLNKNMTQKELALKSGYSYAYLRRVEGPKCVKYFSIQTIYHISQALDIDITQLFESNDI